MIAVVEKFAPMPIDASGDTAITVRTLDGRLVKCIAPGPVFVGLATNDVVEIRLDGRVFRKLEN